MKMVRHQSVCTTNSDNQCTYSGFGMCSYSLKSEKLIGDSGIKKFCRCEHSSIIFSGRMRSGFSRISTYFALFLIFISIERVSSSSMMGRKLKAGLEEIASTINVKDSYYSDSNDLKAAMLDHLGLERPPVFEREDFEKLHVPHHIRSKYNFLKMKHDAVHRVKRSSLANLYHSVRENPGIPGDIVYTDPYREKLEFNMEGRIAPGTVVTMAELRLFKKLPNLSGNLPSDSNVDVQYSKLHPSEFLKNHPGRYMKPVRHARVSIYHSLKNHDGTTKSALVDSRMILVNGSGWQAFDVTDAVHQWQLHPTKIMSMTLEMWIEGTRPGRNAANVARLVRFAGQKIDHASTYRPELVVFTEEAETGSSRNCKKNTNPSKRKCCRDEYYINFREMDWTQYWILEPSGYEAFRCDGKCASSYRRGVKGLPRSCSVAESAPLPVMYLVKRGDITQVEVSEFPNMIVKRCGCSLDSVFVV